MKRCVIFLYFDRDGIVDEYNRLMLADLRHSVDYILTVCNGFVRSGELQKLRGVSDEVISRANVGFDLGGYREGLFYLGWRFLEQFDELILMNYTFFGPFHPFAEMFREMEKKDLDFWGISKHHKVVPDPFQCLPYGYLPEHLQSHFLALRKNLFASYAYRDFMFNRKNPETYQDSICGYEAVFTKYFEDLGYRWEAYLDTDEYEGYSFYPLMFYPKDMLEKKRTPILKRRSFFTDYHDFLTNTAGEASSVAYAYLKESRLMDLNLIWDNLLRLENMTEIHRVMHLNYIVDSEVSEYEPRQGKTAAVVLIEDARWLRRYLRYLREIPAETDLYVWVDKKEAENPDLSGLPGRGRRILGEAATMAGRMREVRPYLDGKAYACVGFLRIAKIGGEQPYSNQDSLQFGDWNSLFRTGAAIRNLFGEFSDNPRMGLMIPPRPDYGAFYTADAALWETYAPLVRQTLDRQGLSVCVNPGVFPLAPMGGSFWIRGSYLQVLWMRELPPDDRLLLYLLPLYVQASGGYTGTGCTDYYAAIETTNQDYILRETNRVIFRKYGAEQHRIVVKRIQNGDFHEGEE